MLNAHGFNDDAIRKFLTDEEFNKSQLCLTTDKGELITLYRCDDAEGNRLLSVGYYAQSTAGHLLAGYFDAMWIMNFLRQYETDSFKMRLRIRSQSPLPILEVQIKQPAGA